MSVGDTISEGAEFEVCGVLADARDGLERQIELTLTIQDVESKVFRIEASKDLLSL